MAADADAFVRLHITPLDAELIKSVIPAPLLPLAQNISYHTIQTFPEKRYGFVELPAADADKLKKKFHGVTFKGCKMRIEKARPEERTRPAGEEDETRRRKHKKNKHEDDDAAPAKSAKRKREVDVLQGVALQDRKVKRGWTEAPAEQKKRRRSRKDEDKDGEKPRKKRPQSKYTEGQECLLKVKVPPSAMKNVPPGDAPAPAAKKKKKSGGARHLTVHEFGKTTTFPSFLRQSAGSERQRAAEFVEGTGWVDEQGNVVEEVKQEARHKAAPVREPTHEEESSGTSSSGDDTSSEESDTEVEEPAAPEKSETPVEQAAPKTLAIHIPSEAAPAVHPLEALYKRAAPATDPEPFSFFGGAQDVSDAEHAEEADDAVPDMPMTPFTRQDFERRRVRSAAPTPDTAHPPRLQHPLGTPTRKWAEEEEEEEAMPLEDLDDDDDDEVVVQGADLATSDFQKWFWENRRDLIRSWMGRRKAAAKEKRHRENKSRASKAV